MAPRDVAAFIPSITAAKKQHLILPPGKPTEQTKLAALVLDVELHTRERWSEVVESPIPEMEALPQAPPATWKRGQMAHVVGEVRATRRGWSQYRLDHYFDKRTALNDVVTPKEITSQPGMAGLDEALDVLLVGETIPAALRCVDLTPKARGGAYRAAVTNKPPDFYGHSFGKALTDAKRRVDSLLRRGQPLGGRIDVYALPLLWLRWDVAGDLRDRVLFYDAHRNLHAYSGQPRDEATALS